MLFATKQDFGVVEERFLRQKYIGYANFCRVKTERGRSIGSASSNDNNKKLAIIKCYNEYLERLRLTIPVIRPQLIKSYNLLDRSINTECSKNFGFGVNNKYGLNDTSGSASGGNSGRVVKKAICELLEKNELLAFWYSSIGNPIEITPEVRKELSKYSFIGEEVEIFFSSEISNYYTCYVIVFNNKKFTCSGVSCSNNAMKSFVGALGEARSIEWQGYNNQHSLISTISNEEHKEIYEHIKHKKCNTKHIKLPLNTIESLSLADCITDITINLVSGSLEKRNITVKCCSRDLLSCLPYKKNIDQSGAKEIIKRYYNAKIPNCIFL